jgi:hypothetical protein
LKKITATLIVLVFIIFNNNAYITTSSAPVKKVATSTPTYKLDKNKYVNKIVNKKIISKTTAKFEKISVTPSSYIIALGIDQNLYLIRKNNLTYFKINKEPLPNPYYYYATFRNNKYYFFEGDTSTGIKLMYTSGKKEIFIDMVKNYDQIAVWKNMIYYKNADSKLCSINTLNAKISSNLNYLFNDPPVFFSIKNNKACYVVGSAAVVSNLGHIIESYNFQTGENEILLSKKDLEGLLPSKEYASSISEATQTDDSIFFTVSLPNGTENSDIYKYNYNKKTKRLTLLSKSIWKQ